MLGTRDDICRFGFTHADSRDEMNMSPFKVFLDHQGFVMLDGGLATEMENRGAELDDALWSAKMLIEAPEMIRQVHAAYLKAGADVIATATYQASFGGFARTGLRKAQAERLMRLSVDLAVLARETFWSHHDNRISRLRPLVAASIGPYGACLADGSEYHGNYGIGRDELRDFHQPRLEVLADTEAELFAFETIPSMCEAEVLLELLQKFPDKYAWLSFSCRDAQQVCHGERFSECAALADSTEQIVGVGVNCTAPRHVPPLLESARPIATPLAAYPNSGEQWRAEDNTWVGEGCEALDAVALYESGARVIGGCCRTTPEDISRMRAALTEHTASIVA